MSDLYIEARLQAIKDIASSSCNDKKDADNIASFCDEIYSAIPNTDIVVKELDEYITKIVGRKSALYKTIMQIVKQCGVSGDCCEWKFTKEIMDNAEFKVGCNPNALKRGIVPNNFSYHDFKYCPYCGKKIKEMERD